MLICLAPSQVLCNPTLGGHFWVYANWTLGLIENGCEVVWLERVWPNTPREMALELLFRLRENLDSVGLKIPVTLYCRPGEEDLFRELPEELNQMVLPLPEVASRADLLLNFYYALEPEVLGIFRKTALVDIDPGLLQSWICSNQLIVQPHDLYFTTGETVGRPDSGFPNCGLNWKFTPPLVHLTSWPVTEAPSTACYTTVSSWWAEWEQIGGQLFSNEKRSSFLEYLDLPSKTPVGLKLALSQGDRLDDEEAAQELVGKGWQIVDAWKNCDTPPKYRRFIQESRGEFSCAKPSCMRLANAWISDRTLCYLASGKPVVVQYTGASSLLREGAGVFRFRSLEEATDAIQKIERNYLAHAQAARDLAEEHFDATKQIARLLELANG